MKQHVISLADRRSVDLMQNHRWKGHSHLYSSGRSRMRNITGTTGQIFFMYILVSQISHSLFHGKCSIWYSKACMPISTQRLKLHAYCCGNTGKMFYQNIDCRESPHEEYVCAERPHFWICYRDWPYRDLTPIYDTILIETSHKPHRIPNFSDRHE